MNRKKKIMQIAKKRLKQANLKANPKKAKPKYISKAERAKLEEETESTVSNKDTTSPSTEEKNENTEQE